MNTPLDLDTLPDADLLTLLEADAAAVQEAMQPRTDPAPLSFAQQRLWYLHQFAPASSAYNIPRALKLSGPLQVGTLEQALQIVTNRHDILRSTFREVDGSPVQCVDIEARLTLEVEDLASLPEPVRRIAIEERIAAHAGLVFDLAQAPLIAAKLLKTATDEHILLLTMHHMVSDAWSNPLLIRDLSMAYAQVIAGEPAALPRPAIQYADFARWQRQDYVQGADCAAAATYWENYLGHALQPLQLPADLAPSPGQRQQPALRHHFVCSAELTHQLRDWCRRENVPLLIAALGAWQLLLSHYSGQSDFTLGVPNAGRNRGETEELVGFFVNTQIYNVHIDTQSIVRDFLQELRRQSLAALTYGDYPLELYLEELRRRGFAPPSRLFQALFNWRVAEPNAAPLKLGALDIEFLAAGNGAAKCDISLDIEYAADAMYCSLQYDSGHFHLATIERLARHWRNLLAGFMADPLQRLGDVPMLRADEWQLTLRDWNVAREQYPSERCIHELIEVQAARTPNAIAVLFGERELTYGQLNTRANQLAHRLIECNVGPDVLVGLAVERSLEMVIGLLAILKAGGAYVPLDPSYPQERLAFMFDDSGVRLLLTQSHLSNALPIPAQVLTLCLDNASIYAGDTSNPPVRAHPENLAYVIYTSGSTGKPKGALLPHSNVLRLFQATAGQFRFDRTDTWTLFHSYAFDFSVWEIFGALLHGGRLLIVPHDVSRSPQEFYALLVRARVTVLNQTPSAFKQLMQVACASTAAQPLRLRYVIFGGEALEVKILRPWFERFGDRAPQLINMYGITETTVHVTYRPLSLDDLDAAAASPIGSCIADLNWYLLNAALHPIAKGSAGELLIGGAGLARGYHRRPGLTAERFTPDPFDPAGGGRLYRTGDLARYRADGVIDYIGRIDQQVKIRGFRIELGEIEARLQEHDQVGEAVVIAQEGAKGASGQQLVAYVVPIDPAQARGSAEIQHRCIDALKARLKAGLPDYMLPAHWVVLERLPLTPNGKLDRKALPAPDPKILQRAYVAPRTELEQRIAALWEELLRVERVGLSDSFFELGGDSIQAIQFVAACRDRLDQPVGLHDLLASPTLEQLARQLAGQQRQQRCIVALNNAAQSSSPLFCVHPSGGMVFSYRPLAKKMEPYAQVYGIQYPGFAHAAAGEHIWRKMVDHYTNQILATQNSGSYRIMGWSLGGSIAWDIAAQLERNGERVAFLGLVDSTIPEALLPADLPRRPPRPVLEIGAVKTKEVSDTLEFFRLLFPELAAAAAAFVQENSGISIGDFYAWASSQLSAGVDELHGMLESVKAEIINAEAFATHDTLEAAFAAFEFSSLQVKPSCWWSQSHKTPQHIAYVEKIVRRYSASGVLNCSIHSPFPHETMVLQDALIESLIEKLI